MTNTGLIISAPASGGGKTTVTLCLLRAFRRQGLLLRSAKSGPDYIDPRFHEAASGVPCLNLDAWAMQPDRICELARGPGTLLVEGAMGLFDGAPPDGKGATADLSRVLGLPVVLVLDVAKQAQSVAAVVEGFINHARDVVIAGVILNKIGSPRHEAILRRSLQGKVPILGAIHRHGELHMPSRHLGLVQASERLDLDEFIDKAADIIAQSIDLKALLNLATPLRMANRILPPLPPPAQSIAIASDQAFAFAYPHLLEAWRSAGAQINLFSPLNNEAPPSCDLVYLPGGYPELHAGRLAAASGFMAGLRRAKAVYGECGGYMTLGDGLIDAKGQRHEMAGLLRLETSFAKRKLTLGYRALRPMAGVWDMDLSAHEFHYATTRRQDGEALFCARDAEGGKLRDMGLRLGCVSGSFAHIIDRA